MTGTLLILSYDEAAARAASSQNLEGGVQQESKWPVVYAMFLEIGSLRGFFSTVRATAVQQDAVLAEDPKCLVY